MSEYIVKILNTSYINHQVKRFQLEKPAGYTFKPGEASLLSINHPDWKGVMKHFTITSLNSWDYLEFIVKIYEKHDGMTKAMSKLHAGDEFIVRDAHDGIPFRGNGVFIAGGTGVTPFLAILRQLKADNHLVGNLLICSNMTQEDLILGEELSTLLGENFINVFTREQVIGYVDRRIDMDFLKDAVGDFDQQFYVCGPSEFVRDIGKLLLDLGTGAEAVVID